MWLRSKGNRRSKGSSDYDSGSGTAGFPGTLRPRSCKRSRPRAPLLARRAATGHRAHVQVPVPVGACRHVSRISIYQVRHLSVCVGADRGNTANGHCPSNSNAQAQRSRRQWFVARMGLFGKIFGMLGRRRKAHVLCVGLDNSGKTTIINWLKPKKTATQEVVPTVGFQVEEFTKANISFTVFDMSGQGRYRKLWEHYYKDVQAVIFVVDTTDKIRMCVAKNELESLLAHEDVRRNRVPVLFFANKMDLQGALSSVEVMEAMELDNLVSEKPWHIQASNATTGEGLEEGLTWLSSQLKD